MMLRRSTLAFVTVLNGIALSAWSAGCGSNHASSGPPGTSAGGAGSGGVSAGTGGTGITFINPDSGASSSGGSCTGLQCQIPQCGSGTTTITGTILDPAGKNPLYGVVAYVPNTAPQAFPSGTACVACDALFTGDPIANGTSDVNGNFTIPNVPAGTNIPLVIQVGKWRKQVTIPKVDPCATTAAGNLTLPRNSMEGDLPDIAISTGGADTLECLLTRIGVDPAEYVPGAQSGGHVHIFTGSGNNPPTTSPTAPYSSSALWDSDADIIKYDLVLLSCEGAETSGMNQQVMMDYTNACGRVFASHFHYAWFNTGPFASYDLATWATGANQIGTSLDANVVTTFGMGQIFQQWLQNNGALQNGELTIYQPKHNADLSASNVLAQSWLEADQSSQSPGAAQDFSFDTPLDATDAGARQGRTVFSDMHVGSVPPGVTADYANNHGVKITPDGCGARDLTAQEKALEFILFNLSSCVTPNTPDGGSWTLPPTQ